MGYSPFKRAARRLRGYLKEESGSATMLSLQFTLITLVVGGLSIDFNKVIADRTTLQLAADTAAHAALYTRETKSPEVARNKALETIEVMLQEDYYDGAILHADVEFGTWDPDTREFTVDNLSTTAVRVKSEMTSGRGNASRNLLLGLVGRKTFNVETDSVYGTYQPPCFTEGFVAEEVVDIQSGNSFFDGFCLHSNQYVSLNQNNFFEPGTVVSMPDLALLDIPNSGFEANEGLEAALRQGAYRLRLLNKLPGMIADLWIADPDGLPRNIDNATGGPLFGDRTPSLFNVIPAGNGKVVPADFEQGRINTLRCTGSGKLTMDPGLYSNFIFVSDCEIKMSQGVVLEDVIIATENTSVKSINSPSGFTLGRSDNCAEGGGSIILTLGGVDVAADLQVYNGQILAIKDIIFSANANGIQGASFISYGQITGTSNMNMGFCHGDGMENIYVADYFRMLD